MTITPTMGVPLLSPPGALPSPQEIAALVTAAYDRFRDLDDGAVADYIPALATLKRGCLGSA